MELTTETVPRVGTYDAPATWDPQVRPALLARSWAQMYPAMTGLLIVLSRRTFPKRHSEVWFRTHFLFTGGQSNGLRHSNVRSKSANGMCPHCGMIALKSVLRRAIGPHPLAGEIIMPSATAGACVAQFGATFACSACVQANHWRIVQDWDLDVLTAPWMESKNPGSKLKPKLCALPGEFSWHQHLPYYVEVDLMRGTIDVRKEFAA